MSFNDLLNKVIIVLSVAYDQAKVELNNLFKTEIKQTQN